MSDEPTESAAPHRGMIPRGDLPFLPRVNWKFWAPILVLLVGFPAVWFGLREREARQRRAQLLREHATLTGTLAPEYRATRGALERWILEAVGPYQGDMRDPALSYQDLASAPVLYARTRVGEVRARADVAPSVRHRYPDQLASCLGVEPAPLRDLLDKGAFLLPSYVDTVRATENADRLRALREDLLFRLRRDTEAIVTGLRHRYFVLVVDESRAAIDAPSRVFVYDLPSRRPLLRARGRGDDVVLIPFRVAGIPAPPPRVGRARRPTVSQHDCAVANTVRAALGVPVLSLQNAPPAEAPAPAAGDAGAGDARAADAD